MISFDCLMDCILLSQSRALSKLYMHMKLTVFDGKRQPLRLAPPELNKQSSLQASYPAHQPPSLPHLQVKHPLAALNQSSIR
jgi:hypothetical protein